MECRIVRLYFNFLLCFFYHGYQLIFLTIKKLRIRLQYTHLHPWMKSEDTIIINHIKKTKQNWDIRGPVETLDVGFSA